MSDDDQYRRELTRQIGTLWRRRHDKEAWLATEGAKADLASRTIISAEIIAYETQIGLLQTALGQSDRPTDDPSNGLTCYAAGPSGVVQGHGMFAEWSEIGSARLVKAVREAWPFAKAPLPWSWESIPAMGGIHHTGRVVASGRYLLADTPGAVSGPRFLGYLARAGALFPTLVREVVALRIALVGLREGDKAYAVNSGKALDEAHSIVVGAKEPEGS